MKRSRFLLFFSVIALVCSSNVMGAALRTFVSALDGADTNDCSRPTPCRSFAAAVAQTYPDGEVIAVDSGGYGPFVLSSPMSIIAPTGVYAGVTAFTGNAITINAGDITQVVLKNLYLNSLGADLGIDANTVGALYVDGCTISGFSEGILFNPSTANARLYVSNSVIRRNALGIYLLTGSARASLESVRLYSNDTGVEANADVTIRRSIASGPGFAAFRAESGSRMTIEDSEATRYSHGFYANAGGVIFATRCMATTNAVAGMKALFSPSAIYVSDSTIAANTIGVSAFSGGIVLSRCTDILTGAPPPPCPAGHFTNTLLANTTDGAFTGSYTSN